MKPRKQKLMLETQSATLDAEDDGTFRELVAALRQPRDDSHGAGNGNGNGNGDGGNGGGGGDDGDRFRRLAEQMMQQMLEAFEQMGEKHNAIALKAFTELLAEMADQVKQVADQVKQVADLGARGDEAIAKTLTAAVMKSLDQSAVIAEAVANFGERFVKLETEVAALKARAGQ
jgi:hypothetical protein